MMELLVSAGASLDVRVPMQLWGETMTWETIVFDSTPISHAQCLVWPHLSRPSLNLPINNTGVMANPAREAHTGRF
jgi:hypothetical protein